MNNDNTVNHQNLEKNLSQASVWALAFGCIIGWGAFVMPGDTFLLHAGPLGTLIGMVIAIMIMILIAYNYHYMIKRYPLAGGEFKYTQMMFGDTHAGICSWFLSLAYILPIAMNATALALIGRTLLNDVFQVGFHYHVAGYDVYMGEVVLAVASSCFLGYLCIRGINLAGNFQVALTVTLVLGVLIIAIAAVVSPNASVENLTPVFSDKPKLGGIFAIVTMAPWAFFGFDTIPQVAEECRFSPQKTKRIMAIAIIFGGAVYIILNTVTVMVLPAGFDTWLDYIKVSKQLNGLSALPTFYVAKELLGTAGLVFIGAAVLAAVLSGIVGFYMASSRLLFSMARENALPEWFSIIDSRYKTPKNAIVFLILLSSVAPFFGRTALGWLVDMSCVGGVIGYLYTSLATIKCARQGGSKKYVLLGSLGTAVSIGFIVLLLVPIPGLECCLDREPYICLVIWTLIGIVLFYTRKKKAALETADDENLDVSII